MNQAMRRKEYTADFCVVGGGLAGTCAAIAAARHGMKTVLVQDRPVLGGNASSEIRMWVCGANGKNVRETGIIEELMLENYYLNPGKKFTVWDSVLYGKAMAEENLTLLLNSSVLDAECRDGRIVSVTAWQSNAETFHTVRATYFADCSGDSVLAPLSGAEYRYGREAAAEFGETIPPQQADRKTMGMSCLFQIRETDHKVTFIPPKWANVYETDDDLPYKDHPLTSNFWWIELGGEWDCIHDTDRCRDELLKICYGVWDHIKNRGEHGADNWELEWIGFLPGKRESRRYVGEYTVTQNDVEHEGRFPDLVAYAGWTMDDHFPEGFYYRAGHPTIYHPAPSPWGLPLRCMISRNIRNLVFAGRNISVTHAALSSSRVMATCAVLGQAIGTAVAQAVRTGVDVRAVDIPLLQNTLMEDDCYLPWHTRPVSPLSLRARCNSETVRSGVDRGEGNCWVGGPGERLVYTLDGDTLVRGVRLVLDSDLDRPYDNMPCRYPLDGDKSWVPATLLRDFDIVGKNSRGDVFTLPVRDNYQRFVRIPLQWEVCSVELVPLATFGCPDFRVFGFEIV